MVLNATFSNIFGTLWRSVLLEKETGVPRENLSMEARRRCDCDCDL
jgi:hypothetical protein